MGKNLIGLVMIGIITSAFTCSRSPESIERSRVQPRYCIDVCIKSQFQNFHSEGNSWGTGSSSMNGLTQEKIYQSVQQYCVDFYKDLRCCEYRGVNTSRTVHGFEYGECK